MVRSAVLQPRVLLIILFFVIFFVLFTRPISEGDCFWHLATGRWIAEHHALPSADPFSFTVTDHNPFRPESNRVEILLKQYWLGQLAMYGVWTVGGDAGIVLLRASVYTAILVFLFAWMRRLNRGILPLVLTFLVGMLLRDYANERPQLFSFLFMPILLYLLEQATQTEKPRRLALLALPTLMLVWANTHGAYMLGVGLIALYLAPDMIASAINRRKPDYPFITCAIAAIAVSALNPNGLHVWSEFFQTLPAYTDAIGENESPWHIAINHQNWLPAYWAFMLICVGGVLSSWRAMKAKHLLVLVALGLLSLTAVRHIYYLLFAAPLLVGYLPVLASNAYSVAIVALVGTIWLGATWSNRILEFRAGSNFPAGVLSFIRNGKPAPRVFNYYDWGGYLEWSLPGLKTFVDGRALVEEIALTHHKTLDGKGWSETFERYGINTVIIPGMNIIYPSLPFILPMTLVDDPEWQLVFVDDRALVFVRDIPANRELIARQAKDRLALQVHLVSLADHLIEIFPDREEYWLTKAIALVRLGDRSGARAAYREVIRINPKNELARAMLSMGGN